MWLRENEPLSAAGVAVPALAARTAARIEALVAERPYPDLVAAIRRGPTGLSPFRLPAFEAAANTIEFFVHGEDVRRGAGNNTPREPDPALEELAWRRLRGMARVFLRRCPVAVWLERDVPAGEEPVRVGRGPDIVTLHGRPTELLLYLFGRRSAANVEVFGEPAAVRILEQAKLGV